MRDLDLAVSTVWKAKDGRVVQRRYTFKLYPTPEQAEILHRHRKMIADLWNGLLERHETIARRTVQLQRWQDSSGMWHIGRTLHSSTWVSERCKNGERVVVEPNEKGMPKPYTRFDMQNEVTWLCNEMPEWRELSVWCAHRTAQLLSRAFDAFYRRAKGGAGSQSGYPRFKPRNAHDSIPHRFASGCNLRRGACDRSWCVTLKGVPGDIHARGTFPAPVEKFTDADVMWRDGRWWLSVAVEIRTRRARRGLRPVHVSFDMVENLARIDCRGETPEDLWSAMMMAEKADDIKSTWPRGVKRDEDEQREWLEATRQAKHLYWRSAELRRHALHVWTAHIVERAAAITVDLPELRHTIKSGRGDKKEWGAEVEITAKLNRTVLSFGGAMAAAMLEYKAAEAGIPCVVNRTAPTNIGIGRELVATGKELRKARRKARKEAA